MSLAQFAEELRDAIRSNQFQRLILSRPRADEARRNVYLRPIQLDAENWIQIVHRFAQRDETENLSPVNAMALVEELLGPNFLDAHLETVDRVINLRHSRKGVPHLARKKLAATPGSVALGHDLAKRRLLDPGSLHWLQDLGMADAQGRIMPSRSAKWRQVDRFVELLDHAWRDVDWQENRPVQVYDMGSGKGYLTFAVEAWLSEIIQLNARVTGIEKRSELVTLCNEIAEKYQRSHLKFCNAQIGDISCHADILIALHACDLATDDALAWGIRSGSAMIVCAPCCQHELRTKMKGTDLVTGLLAHGLLRQRQAALLTDALRTLILEREGYQVRVVEFVDSEHTDKNLLLIATRRKEKLSLAQAKIDALKTLFGLETFYLEGLLL